MNDRVPVVYLLHGGDELGMRQFLDAMIQKLGDSTSAAMNITRFEEKTLRIEDLIHAASAIPFLAPRRIVVVDELSKKITAKDQQAKLIKLFDSLPQSTALVLFERNDLTKSHWLHQWAIKAGDRAFIRNYKEMNTSQLVQWMNQYARSQGGSIEASAASWLAEQLTDEPRAARNEIEKLLAYVNYTRPIEMDDVELLSAFSGRQGDFFKLIDSIATKNAKQAMDMLQLLLTEREGIALFFGLVGHFRLLLQVRELYEAGQLEANVAAELKIHPFRAKKLFAQAQSISMQALEKIYWRLLEINHAIVTGQLSSELALENLVVGLTA